MTAPRSRLMWAVTRDGEIFVPNWRGAEGYIYRTRAIAIEVRDMFKINSPRKWSVSRVRVTPIKNRKRRQ
jgi:hypothetical protein